MKTLNYCGHKHEIGETWNELHKRDALIAHKILNRPIEQLVMPQDVIETTKLAIFMAIMNISQKALKEIEYLYKKEYKDKEDARTFFLTDLKEMTSQLDFIFEKTTIKSEDGEETEEYQLSFTLTKQHFKQIRLKDDRGKVIKLFGPKDAFRNISFYEFTYIASHYSNYIDNRKENTLHRLLAIIYRPPKPSSSENLERNYEGDIRLPLLKYESTIDDRAEIFRDMNKGMKEYLIFWIGCCYMHIISQFKPLFDGNPEKKEADIYGWAGVIQAVSGSPHLIDETVVHNYYTILQKIHLDMIHHDEMEQRMNNK